MMLPDIECGALCVTPDEKHETVSKYENLDSL
jgi:hypothetical protein